MTAVPAWDDQPGSYVGVLRDLTERERFRLTVTDLLGWATGPYLALDDQWRIAVLNLPAERLLGTTESALVGRSLWEVYPAFEDSSFHDRLAAVSETVEPDEFSTYYGPTAQHFRVRAYPTSTGLAVYFRDVTDQVTRERELDLQRRRLAEFASIVSHDLRSPLAVARGHLDMIREEFDGDGERFDAIDRALDRAGAIIDDTLTFAEDVEVDDQSPTDLESVVGRAWEVVENEAATLEVPRGRPIRADPNGLQRILENLLRNAVEHGSTSPRSHAHEDAVEHGSTGSRTPPGDAVDHADGPVTVTVGWLESDESTTGFYVEDDGPGIPPAKRDSVFDPGVTTREDGTGLGLAIVRQVVLAHGWSIRATEGSRGGARFEVTGIDPVSGESATNDEASYAEAGED
jgi:signal transduction histidine kinase